MDYRAIFEVSAAGMTLEKRRLEVATLNLANMHSSSSSNADAYKPTRLVASPIAMDFSRLLLADSGAAMPMQPLTRVVQTDVSPRMVRDPGHPHADAQGFVRYPGVDQATEMISAMSALRAYEANVAAAGFARSMATRALDIGGAR
ncbi:flagellar basal body rod protein FlgC [Paucibacter sp. KBW04]|uniref:flagellar basal body rod protein FlgC n=1 Tax=Paucibacter sp. KBW04 TaxID=2153361 RepID=UPI000F58CC8D|nr:flagellar basal body rod protein FlgC [Paucibacter sp. KBW04]RQO63690.1 flagellar basal body rod protein FlgC [Paucibacter sp. KBW04]